MNAAFVMKYHFNTQSAAVELSILLTLSKYFRPDPKFVFTFDLISPSVESLLFLEAIIKASYEELHFIKDS